MPAQPRRSRLKNGRRIAVNINISQKSNTALRRLGHGNRSAAIEALLEWWQTLEAVERGREHLIPSDAA